MILTNLVSVVRKKDNEQSKYVYESSYNPKVFNKIENLDKIIIMSATAKRKPLKVPENPPIEKKESDVIELNFDCDKFSELRAPRDTSRQKNIQVEEKLMNRSFEILFDYIKPYKDTGSYKTNLWESSETTRSILRTNDFIYEKKATRKVQFLSFDENESTSSLFDGTMFKNIRENKNADAFAPEDPVAGAQAETSLSPKSKRSRKTISSEDFINNAF